MSLPGNPLPRHLIACDSYRRIPSPPRTTIFIIDTSVTRRPHRQDGSDATSHRQTPLRLRQANSGTAFAYSQRFSFLLRLRQGRVKVSFCTALSTAARFRSSLADAAAAGLDDSTYAGSTMPPPYHQFPGRRRSCTSPSTPWSIVITTFARPPVARFWSLERCAWGWLPFGLTGNPVACSLSNTYS